MEIEFIDETKDEKRDETKDETKCSVFDDLNFPLADGFYCPEYIKDHRDLFDKCVTDIQWNQEISIVFGKNFDQPRLTCMMTKDPGAYYSYSGIKRTSHQVPEFLDSVMSQISQTCRDIYHDHPQFNGCLGNYYKTGQNYIALHSDSKDGLEQNTFIASLSLGGERDFDIVPKGQIHRNDVNVPPIVNVEYNGDIVKRFRVKLKPGSLFLMGKGFQENYRHTVPKRARADPRINLTFRVLYQS